MQKYENKKFNKLTIIKEPSGGKESDYKTLVRCDCGTIKEVRLHAVTGGYTKSCGCLTKEKVSNSNKKRALNKGEAAFNKIFYEYKAGAKKRNIHFNASSKFKKYFYKLTHQNCYYCNSSPSSIRIVKNTNGPYKYNGIDRFDNNKGYTIDNIVPCCKICNIAKNSLSVEEFGIWIGKIIYTNKVSIIKPSEIV